MFKRFQAVKPSISLIADACNKLVTKILSLHSELAGREEHITPQLASEITLHLLDEIKEKLHDKEINGVHFEVYVFKRTEENIVGADLLGLLEIKIGDRKLTKAYLAQAKVGNIYNQNSEKKQITCSNRLLQKQVADMLEVSSDSFVFIYTTGGIYVVPALSVKLSGKNSIDTDEIYYCNFANFYSEFFKCFVGDHFLLEPDVKPEDLAEQVRKNRANNALLISAKVNPDARRNTPKSFEQMI